MTMTTKEMIEVLQAYERGEKIEFSYPEERYWNSCHNPSFDFRNYDYRIAKKDPKLVKLLAWFDGDNFFHLREGAEPKWPSKRVPAQDMTIKVEE